MHMCVYVAYVSEGRRREGGVGMGQGPGGQSQQERLMISLVARFLREETI